MSVLKIYINTKLRFILPSYLYQKKPVENSTGFFVRDFQKYHKTCKNQKSQS
jgi:hypothetical protein